MIRVILGSNELDTLSILRQCLSAHPEMEIAGEATTKHELSSLVSSLRSELLVVSDEWGDVSLLDLLSSVRDTDIVL